MIALLTDYYHVMVVRLAPAPAPACSRCCTNATAGTQHLWNANRNDELHMGRGGHRDNDAPVAGRRGWIQFDSDLTLITVETHTDAWLAALRAGFDLILFGLDAFAWWWMRLCCRM